MTEKDDTKGSPLASIVITTKNRCSELRRTLQSCQTQLADDLEIEILVVDDDSNDGTRQMVAAEFPTVRLIHKTSNPGYIVSRNLAAKLAKAPIIISIDDDAIFTTSDIVACTVNDFADPKIGAVAIPHVHVTDGPQEHHRAPDKDHIYIGPSFTGTAHAVRRELFLSLGGYREVLVHQGEEIDYCFRLLNAGYYVRLGTSDPIHHYPSARRNYPRQLFYGARNSVLITWFNAPWPILPMRIASNVAGGLYQSVRLRHPLSVVAGTFAGLGLLFNYRRHRLPISPHAYRVIRDLQKGIRRAEDCDHFHQIVLQKVNE
jgi:glycosyltransferase involved in cell wall biosynthesis